MIYFCLAAIAVFYFGLWLRRYMQRPSGGLKMTLSGAFCFIGAAACARRGADLFSVLAVAGLLFGALGDYFLIKMENDSRAFVRGVGAFAVNQLAYILAMISAGHRNNLATVLVFVLIMAASGWLIRLLAVDMGRETLPVTVYIALVTFMCAKSATLPFALRGAQLWIFAAGGVLFYLSDLVLALWKYHGRNPDMRALNSLLYFTAQFIIAASLLF